MNKFVKLIFCLAIQYPLAAQQRMDSLKNDLKDGSLLAQTEAAIAISKYYLNINVDSAGCYGDKALQLARKLDDERLLSQAYHIYGNYKLITSAFSEALDYFLKARNIIERLVPLDTISLLKEYSNISIVYERQEDIKNSYQYSEKAIELLGSDKNPQLFSISASVYSGMANILLKLRDTVRGIEFQQKGLERALSVANYTQASILLNNLGNVFLTQRKFDQSYHYMIKAKQIREKNNDQRGLSSSYRNLSNYFKEIKQYDSAIFYAKQTLKSLNKIKGTLEIYSDIYNVLSGIYQGQKKYDSALLAFQTHMLYKDSLFNNEKFKEFVRIEAKHEMFRKTAEERELVRINQIRTYVVMGTLLAIVVILFLLYYVQKFRAKLREEKLLADQNNLRRELDYKNRDLVTHGLFLIKKDEFISEVIHKLNELKNSFPEESHKTIIKVGRDLTSLLSRKDNSWREFELRFREVHQEFFDQLDAKYPDLTSRERRLCALLKLDMSTKEISSITNQSPRSLEVARSRLRKKFSLTNSEITLTDFLTKLGKQ